jgi:hypothetical protein
MRLKQFAGSLIITCFLICCIVQASNVGYTGAASTDLRFGVNYQSTNHHYSPNEHLTDEVLDRDFQLFKNQGLQFIVLNVIWKYFEPVCGVYNEEAIGNLARVCAFADKYGLKVVIDFHTIANKDSSWSIPEWVAPRYFETVFTNSTVRQAWLSFLAHMAYRLDGVSNLESWQMMNEPARNSWACDVSVDDYVNLWTDMKTAIGQHSTKPVSIRFSAQTFYHFNNDPRIYGVCDYFSINWYIEDGPVSQGNFTAAVLDAQAHNRKVMVSEFGSDTGQNGDLLDEAGVTEQYQDSLDIFRALGVDECAAFFWRADYNSTTPSKPGTGLNLAKSDDGTPREAFLALKNPPPPTPTPTSTPNLTVTSPNGGETVERGTACPVSWTTEGNTGGYVKIELLKANAVNRVITSRTANDGSYSWTVPQTQTTGADYKIRITSKSNAALMDSSDGNFAITRAAASLNVTSPNGGERWTRGTVNTITWASAGSPGGYVKIELLKAGQVNRVIASSTVNDGSYGWSIPRTQTTGTDYTVRITSTSSSAIKDTSNGTFTISSGAVSTLTVTSPDGGESWAKRTTHTITWYSTGSPGNYVKIELLKAGTVNRVIASSTANDGAYSWMIPSTVASGSDYRIQVTSISNSAIKDASNINFSVR